MSSMLPTEIDRRLQPMPDRDFDRKFDPFRLEVGKGGLRLMLHRLPVDGGRRPVLLLHGASAASNTFLTPRHGAGGSRNLLDYLAMQGFEPWLLDWRGSKYVAEQIAAQQIPKAQDTQLPDRALFNFDVAATEDIKAALNVIARERKGEIKDIGAVGFCMGGAILAQALLENTVGVSDRLSHVVLISLGLFYSMSLYGRLKAESRLLERVVSEQPKLRFLDPTISQDRKLRADWPDFVERLYELWWHPYEPSRMDTERVPERDRYVLDMFNRISFMLGEPYLEANLVPEIHDTTLTLDIKDSRSGPLPTGVLVRAEGAATGKGELAYPFAGDAAPARMVVRRHEGDFPVGQRLFADGQPVGSVAAEPVVSQPLLPELFGAMELHFLLHGAENLRAGQATRFSGKPTVAPIPHIKGGGAQYAGFNQLTRTTLIGGGRNRLWHRDSIDRMWAWLERNPAFDRRRYAKHILLDFGHQDLLWGRESARKVFPLIKAGLT
jgi:pimeloyl-ACP methyl ester carboxylesterase